MDPKNKYNVVAKAVRIEHVQQEDRVFIVFEVIDEKFKKRIKEDWTQDIDLKVVDKKLVEFTDDTEE